MLRNVDPGLGENRQDFTFSAIQPPLAFFLLLQGPELATKKMMSIAIEIDTSRIHYNDGDRNRH